MKSYVTVSLLSLFALSSTAAPADGIPKKRAASASCPSYTIINTRGTGELQGQSAGFRTMNSQITDQLSGGKIYNTVYPAGFSQNSASGTRDIINQIAGTLETNPDECFILQGYSQGAAATVNAMPSLTGASFEAVKGVFLIGDPHHKSGLACNVDNNGGTTTKDVNGLSAALTGGIPEEWIGKTSDVCIFGDGVCDTTNGAGINAQHLQYPRDSATQQLGADFAIEKLGGSS
ncbi:putative cutinase 1 [Rosellinia necatrix]|uniref:Putative cutinase 1 n=1 Tax=Rosellinia necatrix TaxID=77044 RepID=A0A1W2TV14_ROSNE|nr:putative cutinase 1 [Rosellinia necatrix]